jgi:hypothetical protein
LNEEKVKNGHIEDNIEDMGEEAKGNLNMKKRISV